jgi:hypothetical protein
MRTYLKKPFIKIGLAEWLKVKALSSSPSTAKKKKKKRKEMQYGEKNLVVSYKVQQILSI